MHRCNKQTHSANHEKTKKRRKKQRDNQMTSRIHVHLWNSIARLSLVFFLTCPLYPHGTQVGGT
jgi:hypothetical protein